MPKAHAYGAAHRVGRRRPRRLTARRGRRQCTRRRPYVNTPRTYRAYCTASGQVQISRDAIAEFATCSSLELAERGVVLIFNFFFPIFYLFFFHLRFVHVHCDPPTEYRRNVVTKITLRGGLAIACAVFSRFPLLLS